MKRSEIPSSSPASGRRYERGSAFIIALLALLVLTIIGLSLALITQGEVEVGASERSVHRAFYAADAGASDAIARILVKCDARGRTFEMEDYETPAANGVKHRVTVSGFLWASEYYCNLCDVSSEDELLKVSYWVNSASDRVDGNGTVLASQSISEQIDLQPVELCDGVREFRVENRSSFLEVPQGLGGGGF